ncbi:hypothetical protein [Nonomuraea recticatena]|uniref:Uncharacterized protein n=1 Tax=Nonomuraea recticatena TaxID=46178 RepID=A0ABP6E4F7_9ACTN
MAVTVNEATMTSDITDTTAARISAPGEPDLWTVTGRHSLFTRNQAITAMMIAEHRAADGDDDSPHVAQWEQELLVPIIPTDRWALLQTLKLATAAVNELPRYPEVVDVDAAISHAGQSRELLAALAEAADNLTRAARRVADVTEELVDADAGECGRWWEHLERQAREGAGQVQGGVSTWRRASRTAEDAQDRLIRLRGQRKPTR